MGIGMSRPLLTSAWMLPAMTRAGERLPLSFKPYKIENVFNWVKPPGSKKTTKQTTVAGRRDFLPRNRNL
jgi:hypothetical protein